MNKVLIVVYSYTGTCRRLATKLSQQQGWPVAEVRDAGEDGKPVRGLWRCLIESWRRREPPILYEGPQPAEFDIVVTVSPIWVYRMASPMRSFLAEHRAQLRQLAVVSVMGGRGAPRALAEVTRLTNRRPVAELSIRSRELQDATADTKLASFSTRVGTWDASQAQANTHAWLPERG